MGLESGVYYGLAGVPRGCGEVAKEGSSKGEGNGEGEVYEMVMSVGWNPFYGNERRSVVSPHPRTINVLFPGYHLTRNIGGSHSPQVSREFLWLPPQDSDSRLSTTRV